MVKLVEGEKAEEKGREFEEGTGSGSGTRKGVE